jgi:hypothetical protein
MFNSNIKLELMDRSHAKVAAKLYIGLRKKYADNPESYSSARRKKCIFIAHETLNKILDSYTTWPKAQ